MMYANDYDNYLPLAGQWMDNVRPYVKGDDVFHSLAVSQHKPSAYGFALNSTLAGTSQTDILEPATKPMVFDSTMLTRNATAGVSTLPSPPRYGKDNLIGYADGHVKLVP
jgi:hypothetical protein